MECLKCLHVASVWVLLISSLTQPCSSVMNQRLSLPKWMRVPYSKYVVTVLCWWVIVRLISGSTCRVHESVLLAHVRQMILS